MSKEIHNNDMFQLNSIRELLQLLGQTDITELSLERDGSRLHIKRHGYGGAMAEAERTIPPVLSAATLAPFGSGYTHHATALSVQDIDDAPPEQDMPAGSLTVLAPMVGTFYNSPSPKDPPFVQEGDEVQEGDTVGIIEAMKIMNEIECEVTGRVLHALVKNGQPVEYGQPLLIIAPL